MSPTTLNRLTSWHLKNKAGTIRKQDLKLNITVKTTDFKIKPSSDCLYYSAQLVQAPSKDITHCARHLDLSKL